MPHSPNPRHTALSEVCVMYSSFCSATLAFVKIENTNDNKETLQSGTGSEEYDYLQKPNSRGKLNTNDFP